MKINLVGHPTYYNWAFRPSHPTQGRRYSHADKVLASLAAEGKIELANHESPLASEAELCEVHSQSYVQRVVRDAISSEWDGARPDLAEIARYFYGGTLRAGQLVEEGELLAVNLAGAKHHAMPDHSSGFCVFGDFGALAKRWSKAGHKVAVLDIDVHQGDGTEEICREDSNILTFSIHDVTVFPATGKETESDLNNQVFNRPLARGAGNAELLAAVQEFCEIAKNFGAERLLIAVGGDGHESDPLGTLLYTESGVAEAMAEVRAAFPSTPIVFGGAGGYRPDDYTPSMWLHAILALAGWDVEEIEGLGLLDQVREAAERYEGVKND